MTIGKITRDFKIYRKWFACHFSSTLSHILISISNEPIVSVCNPPQSLKYCPSLPRSFRSRPCRRSLKHNDIHLHHSSQLTPPMSFVLNELSVLISIKSRNTYRYRSLGYGVYDWLLPDDGVEKELGFLIRSCIIVTSFRTTCRLNRL